MADEGARVWNFVDALGKRWHCHATGDWLTINAVDDAGKVTDRLRIEREGERLCGRELTNLDAFDQVPELKQLKALVRSQAWVSRLREGANHPVLLHTRDAAIVWPIFGKGAMPAIGAANVQGVSIVWSPDLDRYVAPL